MTPSDWKGPVVGRLYRPPPRGQRDAVRRDRGPRVLLALHDDCTVCREWRRDRLDTLAPEIGRWGGRIVAEAGRAPASEPWLAVVDEWDQVFHVARFGSEHTFPDVDDVVEWVRFVAIQCEECEAPEGPWRSRPY